MSFKRDGDDSNQLGVLRVRISGYAHVFYKAFSYVVIYTCSDR